MIAISAKHYPKQVHGHGRTNSDGLQHVGGNSRHQEFLTKDQKMKAAETAIADTYA